MNDDDGDDVDDDEFDGGCVCSVGVDDCDIKKNINNNKKERIKLCQINDEMIKETKKHFIFVQDKVSFK